MGEEKDLVGIDDPDELEAALAQLKIEDLEELARATPADTFGDRRVFDEFEDDFPTTEDNGSNNNNIVSDNDDSCDEPIGFVEDIEPVDPWCGEREPENFTEEELINVLRSFEEVPDDIADDDIVDYPTGDVLPELEFLETDDSAFLPPDEFTASIFDGDNINNNNNNNQEEEGTRSIGSESDDRDEKDNDSATKPNGTNTTNSTAEGIDDDEKKGDLDDEALGLLEGLQKLNLDWQAGEEEGGQLDDFDGDALPPYLYCQPCTPVGLQPSNATSFSLASIAEDEALLDPSIAASADLRRFFQEEGRPKLPQKEFDTLLQLSLLSGLGEDEENPLFNMSEKEMDSLFHNAASQTQLAQAQSAHDNHHPAITQQPLPPTSTSSSTAMQQEPFTVSNRAEAFDAAAPIMASFTTTTTKAGGHKNERSCLGHKETIFGMDFSECGKYLATASQDSTVRVWDVKTNAALSTLNGHSTDHECLRVAWASSEWATGTLDRGKDSKFSSLLATAGADGKVKVWASKDPSQKDSWTCCATLDHADLDRVPFSPEDEKEKPQIYALQWINHWSGLPVANEKLTKNSFLLTSSDDFVHLWELEDDPEFLIFREVMSLNFASFHNHGYGVSLCQVTDSGLGVKPDSSGPAKQGSTTRAVQKPFGGDRNPNNLIFVFDADYCKANGLLGVALSDGSLRLINGRGVCISIVALPGCQSHLTSFSWDATGTRLATSVATGHVILWGIEVHEGHGSLTTTCSAILEGGHQPGRPVFGSMFFGAGENLLVTWGVDGRLCLWDSFSAGNINAPIAALVANAEYPIYAVDAQTSCIAVGGGKGEPSFLGTPVLIYDIKPGK